MKYVYLILSLVVAGGILMVVHRVSHWDGYIQGVRDTALKCRTGGEK